ncbi:MAG: hypothetical protein EI684_21530 [Candidatus Viridilinea halotolerans]|uniref:PBP domain-containing protein n=1 Tax=Candidatus Viridilinea halotolerans TaxID=2491704 RepID=A0A426TRB6_9CHLR|nr:MAG: hypothetical protein EI684_21530 [Candidatus Viridilinea halotolerans]
MRSLAAVFALITALSLVACSTPSASPAPTAFVAPSTKITLAGSGGGLEILDALLIPFQRANPDVLLEFLVSSGGEPALRGAQAGEFDLAVLLTANHAGAGRPGLTLLSLAADPLVFIRHADLPLSDLSVAQIRAIYTGRITNWSAVGGPNLPIVVLTRNEDNAATHLLRTRIFGREAWQSAAIVLGRAADLREAVLRTPGSIGFGSYGDFMLNGLQAQVLTVDGIHPREPNYPIPPRWLVVAYPSAQRDALDPLLSYLQSDATRLLLTQNGMVPNE